MITGGSSGAGLDGITGTGPSSSEDNIDSRAGANSTNAIGSSNVDPGRLLVSNETRPSPIGDPLDILTKSCDCLELSSCSALDIHRMMDAVV